MAGIKALRKIQLGQEATAGTDVAATTIWRGLGTIEDTREIVFPEEDVALMSGTDRSYTQRLGAAITFESVEATFEQICHILAASVKTVSGSQDGTGSGYVYSYTLPTTSANTIKTYSIEGGDNQQAEVMEYAFVQSFTLEGAGGEAVMMSADWIGRQVQDTSFTGSVSLPTVEEVLFSSGKLYLDAVGGSFGGTLDANSLLDFSLSYDSGIVEKWSADGNDYFSFIQYTQPELVLNMTYEHNSTAGAEKDYWDAETARLIRLKFEGSDLSSSGNGDYTKKTAIIDLAGKYSDFDAISDQDGNDIVSCEFRSRYDETAADWGKFVIVNENASIP